MGPQWKIEVGIPMCERIDLEVWKEEGEEAPTMKVSVPSMAPIL